MIFYFSGCGNSRHVADTLAKAMDETLVFIPDAEREGRYEYTLADDERLGFVFPVYSWAPPKLVLDFVKRLHVTAKPGYVYFACTCGDQCGHTEKIFRKAMDAKGWTLNACFSIQMPETYIGMPGFNLDSDENARRKISEGEAAMARLIPKVQAKERFSEIIVGGAAWIKSYLVNPGFNRYATDDSKYHVTDQCIHCGKCVKVCPLNNISLEDGKPQWHGHCTICMACYHHCPVNAIQYGKATAGKGQYYYGR